MAQIVFPPNPSVGDQVTGEYGEVYTWDGQKWTITPSSSGGGIAIGDDPPDDPVPGMLWWSTGVSKLYLWDGLQWVVVVNTPEGGGGGGGGGGGPPYEGPIIGVTDGSNAAPGMVGEYLESVFPASAPAMIEWGRPAVATTLNLTPGDWDVWGTVVVMRLNAGDVAASFAWIQTTPPEITDWPSFGPQGVAMYGNATWIDYQVPSQIMAINPMRVSSAAATTVYLVTWIGASSDANSPYSCAVSLAARRVR